MTVYCSNSDHDGHAEPATVHIADGLTIDYDRCQYCAEGLTSKLMRAGCAFEVSPIS